MKQNKFFIILFFVLFSFSCMYWIPGGVAPDGPIVDSGVSEQKIFTSSGAVNYMTVLLAMKCPPIACAGAIPPRVASAISGVNSFSSELQRKMWVQLSNSGLISPSAIADSNYILYSKMVKECPENDLSYIWRIRIVDSKSHRELWREQIKLVKGEK